MLVSPPITRKGSTATYFPWLSGGKPLNASALTVSVTAGGLITRCRVVGIARNNPPSNSTPPATNSHTGGFSGSVICTDRDPAGDPPPDCGGIRYIDDTDISGPRGASISAMISFAL